MEPLMGPCCLNDCVGVEDHLSAKRASLVLQARAQHLPLSFIVPLPQLICEMCWIVIDSQIPGNLSD